MAQEINAQAGNNSAYPSVHVKIQDDFSGIKTYRAMLDGKWYLMEYDAKNNMLTGDPDKISDGKNHKLELVITDAAGNSTTLTK